MLGKGRAVSARRGWSRAAGASVCPRALGRELPSHPDKRSMSKLIMSLAGGRELQILEEELWWRELV